MAYVDLKLLGVGSSRPGPRVTAPFNTIESWRRRPSAEVEGFLDELRATLEGIDLAAAGRGLRDEHRFAERAS